MSIYKSCPCLESITEAADVVLDPGRNCRASEEIQPGLDNSCGGKLLEADWS